MRDWAVNLEAKPKYVVSSTRKDFPWTNSHHIADDLRTGVRKLKDATPDGVLLGSGKLATAPQRRGCNALPARALTRRWVMPPNNALYLDESLLSARSGRRACPLPPEKLVARRRRHQLQERQSAEGSAKRNLGALGRHA